MFKRKVSALPYTTSELDADVAKAIADLVPTDPEDDTAKMIVEAKPQNLDDDGQNIGFAALGQMSGITDAHREAAQWLGESLAAPVPPQIAPTPTQMPSTRAESEAAMRYAHDDIADAEAAVVRAKERLDRLISHHNSLPRG